MEGTKNVFFTFITGGMHAPFCF